MSASARTVSIYDAKTHLSQLVGEVEQGRQITITRHGRPVATIGPCHARNEPRVPGALRGQITVAEGWDRFTEDDDQDWYGS